VCIGGGPLQDCVGVAASLAHRGVRFLRMPTSLLSQGDSGVGVKCAVDFSPANQPSSEKHLLLKNWMGAFYPPAAVINCQELLTALTEREWLSGCSELIKAGVVWNQEVFALIEANTDKVVKREKQFMKVAIAAAAREYMNHIAVAGDPWELIPTPPFYHAHCCAHWLEKVSVPKVMHAEAVAVGICVDIMYQYLKGHASKELAHRFVNIFWAIGLQVMYESLWEHRGEIDVILDDFRVLIGGKLCMPMLYESKDKSWTMKNIYELDKEVYIKALEEVRNLQIQHNASKVKA